ncbi:MAG: hypothetical protein AAGC55_29200, partial [Myxococcota bacterium]
MGTPFRTLFVTVVLGLGLTACSFDFSSGDDQNNLGVDGDTEPAESLIDDDDGDGVAAELDCDDNNTLVGALLYEEDFDEETSFVGTAKLTDSWTLSDGTLSNDRGGQQAQLMTAMQWENTVTFAQLSADGLERKCRNCNYGVHHAGPPDCTDGGQVFYLPGLFDGNPDHVVRMRAKNDMRFSVDRDTGAATMTGTVYIYDLGGSPVGSQWELWTVDFTFSHRGVG